MMKSLFSGVSGLKNHNVRMDVIGNNIANVNTTGYKANNVTFRDVFYQTRTYASSGDVVSGGVNPRQVGYGLAMGSIGKVMTQSGFTFSDSVYDCAIQGEGFFQVMDAAGNIYYTRNGVFNVDNIGNLVDSNGNIVLGVSGDPRGIGPSSQRINLYVPDVMNEEASALKEIKYNNDDYEIYFRAANYGPNGNIAINVIHDPVPFATMNGNVLTVQLPLDTNFASPAAYQQAVNDAIFAGGLSRNDWYPLTIEFPSGIPLHTAATIAALPAGINPETGLAYNINPFTMVAYVPGDPNTDKQPATNFIDLGGTGTNTISFTAAPGLEGNRIEVNLKSTSNANAPRVGIQWNQNVCTITVNETVASTTPPIAAGTPITAAEINAALAAAAGTNPNRLLIAAGVGDGNALTGAIVGDATRRVRLANGADTFYRTASFAMSTVVLDNGRFAGAQTTRDLDLVYIDSGGVIYGEHPVHGTILLGRIDIVLFQNANGLQEVGTSYYKESLASGKPEVKLPESDGAGEIVSSALEMANVDLSQEFSDMIITQRGFQANSRIITVSDTMLEELINLKR